MTATPHLPAIDRNLPVDLYGRFEIRMTQDGGKEFSLPHTLSGTVLAIMSGRRALATVGIVAAFLALLFPVQDPHSPLTRTWLYMALLFLLVHLGGAFLVLVFGLVTGMRKLTRITIREDGMIWNDQHFLPVEHLWSISYGTTSNEGRPDEVFEPLVTVQLGTQEIVLAEGLEVASAKLFKRVFAEDIRRYWHRHN